MKKVKSIRGFVNLIAFGLVIASVVQELRKPSEERTWHGTIAGFVPYDLRFPTGERLRASFWNPEDPRILVPMAFGVGWSLNVGALLHGIGVA